MYVKFHRSDDFRELTQLIRQTAFAPGNDEADLDEHQVTADGVPVLVDACLQFVFRHGLEAEGIYRVPGVASRIKAILESFLDRGRNAWEVSLTLLSTTTPHDVADALRRFLRSLPRPLLVKEEQGELSCIADMPSLQMRVSALSITYVLV